MLKLIYYQISMELNLFLNKLHITRISKIKVGV